MKHSSRTLTAGIALALTLLAGAAPSQVQPPAQVAPASGPPVFTLKSFAAHSLARLALIDLRLRSVPEPEDCAIACKLVGSAETFLPGDPELVRWQSVLAEAAEDEAELEAQLRRMVAADPRDTAVQFRLISLQLNKIQSVEDRLAAYERLLSPAGSKIDPAVRSRLALDSAILFRERGDTERYGQSLKLACTLDGTNKEAAAAALAFFAVRLDDPMGKLELLANLLNADPLDGYTHVDLAHHLAAGGAFEAAGRFLTNSRALFLRSRIDTGTDGLIQELTLDWQLKSPNEVLKRLQLALDSRQNEVKQMVESLKEQGVGAEQLPDPNDVRLEPTLDRLRMMAAAAAGNEKAIQETVEDLRETYFGAFKRLDDLVKNPPPGTELPKDPQATVRDLKLEMISALGWPGCGLQIAGEDLKAVEAEWGEAPESDALKEARAWMLARTERAAEAMEMFKSLPSERSSHRIGVAVTLETLKRRDEAVAAYQRIVAELPLTVEACWALWRLSELKAQSPAATPLADKMRAFAGGIPTRLDEMCRDPRSYQDLSIAVVSGTLSPLDSSYAKVRLTNLSAMPLALGPGLPIDARIMLSPSIETTRSWLKALVRPEVVDMERRLRLMPRETIEVLTWVDPGLTGWLIESLSDETVRVRLRAIQGYRRDESGQVVPGSNSLAAASESLERTPLIESLLSAAEIAQRFGACSEAELPAVVVAARTRLLAQIPPPAPKARDDSSPEPQPLDDRPVLADEDRTVIAAAAAARFGKASPPARALMVAGLPHEGQVAPMRIFDEVCRSESDPTVLGAVIVSRIKDAADPILEAAKASPDARLSAIATLHASRLEKKHPVYATAGPGFANIDPLSRVKREAPAP